MFKITRDAVYLSIIFWLVLIITIEFHWFVRHYEYLVSVLGLMHRFKNKHDLALALKVFLR